MTLSPPSVKRSASAIAPSLQSAGRAIAQQLAALTGASSCYLGLIERQGSSMRLVASDRERDDPIVWRQIGGAALLSRAVAQGSATEVVTKHGSAVLLPLSSDGEPLGAAVLLFAPPIAPEIGLVVAAGALAAQGLGAARQVALLHLQAEEVAERTRLREIQLSRNLIRGVIDGVPMGLALLDTGGTVLAANRALSERVGLEPAALVGQFYGISLGSWDDSPASHSFRSAGPERVRRAMSNADGSRALLEIASIPLSDQAGDVNQVVEVWEDITERVALQTQLVRAEKLAAIGQLAASIAHEVGNPLQAIQGFLSLFLEQCAPDLPNQYFLQLAEEEIERIVHVLSRLRDLYRPRAEVVKYVNLNDIVISVLLLTGRQLERGKVKVRRDLDERVPEIRGVSDQLKQVLLNLVLNAAEAMPDGGLLTIRTAATVDQSGQELVVLSLTDTGVGIPPDQLARIFDGLHTTKERGMGLGLYTSKVIVDRHLGRLSVTSQAGEGTTFSIALPSRGDGPAQIIETIDRVPLLKPDEATALREE